ncbi:MAG: iron-sulfur cluster assembly protein [Candidatus Thorarchaeota archaeon]
MSDENSQLIADAIRAVKHPAIDLSLVELGIIRRFSVHGTSVHVEFAWPFQGIPIRDQLILSVKSPVENLGAQMTFSEDIMSNEERQKFLMLEQMAWRGL